MPAVQDDRLNPAQIAREFASTSRTRPVDSKRRPPVDWRACSAQGSQHTWRLANSP